MEKKYEMLSEKIVKNSWLQRKKVGAFSLNQSHFTPIIPQVICVNAK